MRFSDISSYPRAWNREIYPIIGHVEVDAESFRDIERDIKDMTQTTVLGHDLADHDRIIIHVACTTEDVRGRLERRWT